MTREDSLALDGQFQALEEAIAHHLATCHPNSDGSDDDDCPSCAVLAKREEELVDELAKVSTWEDRNKEY